MVSHNGLAAAIVAIALAYHSCDRGIEFNIETRSPKQVYVVRFSAKKTPPRALPGEFYVQDVRLVAAKGKDFVVTDDNFFHNDPYDPLFLEAYPIQEWISDSILRLGNAEPQPFQDEITLVNRTAQALDLVVVEYGKRERFLIFDLKQGGQLKLKASPQFGKENPATGVFYTAYCKGRSFSGSHNEVNQRNLQGGPLRILVDVEDKSVATAPK